MTGEGQGAAYTPQQLYRQSAAAAAVPQQLPLTPPPPAAAPATAAAAHTPQPAHPQNASGPFVQQQLPVASGSSCNSYSSCNSSSDSSSNYSSSNYSSSDMRGMQAAATQPIDPSIIHAAHIPPLPPAPPPPPPGRPGSAAAAAATAAPPAAAAAPPAAAAAAAANAVETDMDLIISLISAKETEKAADLLLEKLQSSNLPPRVYLQLRTLRFFCLLRLSAFAAAAEEAAALGDLCAPYWNYEQHPHLYPGKKGSMVPFSLHVLLAVAPHLWGNSLDSLSALSLLLQRCKQQMQSAAAAAAATAATAAAAAAAADEQNCQRLWKARLIKTAFLLAVVLTAANYPEEAVRVLQEEVLPLDEGSSAALSLMGRISLKMGCTDCAEQYFTYADCSGVSDSCIRNTNHGLLLMFTRRIGAAADAFEAAVHASGAPLGVAVSGDGGGPLKTEEDPWGTACEMCCPPAHAVCCNNGAVAKFYGKRLEDATADLEGFIQGNPAGAFAACVRNLTTLYEFGAKRDEFISMLQQTLKAAAARDKQIQYILTGN